MRVSDDRLQELRQSYQTEAPLTTMMERDAAIAVLPTLVDDLLDARQALSDRDARITELQSWIAAHHDVVVDDDDIAYCLECNGENGQHRTAYLPCSVPRLLAESTEPPHEH